MRLRSIHLLLTINLCVFTAFVFVHSPSQAADNQTMNSGFESIDGMREQVKNYLYDIYTEKLVDRLESDPNDLTVAIARLDSRLKLRQCNSPLTFELLDNGQLGGNISVRTRCESTPNWSIFVQAQVNFSLSVLVARHNLTRGSIVQFDDLEQQTIDQRKAGRDYVTNTEAVVGKELKRQLQQGHAVRLAMLLEPKVIKRGDAVIVEAQAGNIFVATPGTALSDGKMGQQIRVKNESSRREIKVKVVGPGRVRVIM